jgi:hypothetical protein
MSYMIDAWGIDENGERFVISFPSKSSKRNNWLAKMREKFGTKINFDSVNDFGFRILPRQDWERLKNQANKARMIDGWRETKPADENAAENKKSEENI